MTRQAWICHGLPTPIGRYGGALTTVRPVDLAVTVINAIVTRNPKFDSVAVDDLLIGYTNQSGEDNRNVPWMSGLLSKLPDTVPAMTVNRLCASGVDSVEIAARSIGAGEADLCIDGGVESTSRAPFVVPKTATPVGRNLTLLDTTMG
ncbi:MAG: beta-ketoacyl synthase N-terminal-like domain-containing protein [Planctomycetota bacterium]|nr:beta-ketoacyl synthase N-terminal-like domain-containing protein [Planctomycetota bacterium]